MPSLDDLCLPLFWSSEQIAIFFIQFSKGFIGEATGGLNFLIGNIQTWIQFVSKIYFVFLFDSVFINYIFFLFLQKAFAAAVMLQEHIYFCYLPCLFINS